MPHKLHLIERGDIVIECVTRKLLIKKFDASIARASERILRPRGKKESEGPPASDERRKFPGSRNSLWKTIAGLLDEASKL